MPTTSEVAVSNIADLMTDVGTVITNLDAVATALDALVAASVTQQDIDDQLAAVQAESASLSAIKTHIDTIASGFTSYPQKSAPVGRKEIVTENSVAVLNIGDTPDEFHGWR